jgi:hypothetical protein
VREAFEFINLIVKACSAIGLLAPEVHDHLYFAVRQLECGLVRHMERTSRDATPSLRYNLNLMIITNNLLLIACSVSGKKMPLHLKNGVFWDVTPCGSCKNGRFGGT